jgi:tetratricopeptide (TPR) repeat protein
MESPARIAHAESVSSREEKQDYATSLAQNTKALLAYDKAGDTAGFAEGLANMAITFGIVGENNSSDRLRHLARALAAESVDQARSTGDESAEMLPLYQLSKADAHLGKFTEAVQSCSQAVRIMRQSPPERHSSKGLLAEMEARLATFEYRTGDMDALTRAEEAIAHIKTADDVPPYEKDVWASGGWMHLAEAVADNDPTKAGIYMEDAKKIIDANPDLTIRKTQWNALSEKLQSK